MKKLIVLIIFLALTGCKGEEKGKTLSPAEETVYNVRAWNAVKTDVMETITAVGTLKAEDEAIIRAEVSAKLTLLKHDEGEFVKKGELLAFLDEERFTLDVLKSAAEAKKAKVSYEYAEKNFLRVEKLFKEGFASEVEYDNATSEKLSSKAFYEAARAAVELKRKALKDSSIEAPFSGFIAKKYATPGTYLKEGDDIFKLTSIDPINVSAHIPEVYLKDVKPGAEVLLNLSSSSKKFSGQVSYISPEIDEKNRTFEIKAEIANPDGILRPGLFAGITIVTGLKKGVFAVPEKGVIMRGDKNILFVIKGDEAKERSVTAVQRTDGKIIVAEGIEEEDAVIVEGAHNLKNNSKIKLIKSPE